ncbi:hypothetical protein CKAH01_18489 [Colletotrichum kahawae]|uniref:Uncharacterized protein n=1 Tax=Colletotrichum kahawae TaxID=34407 RepID=A0AAD9Y674_COLKA|nr:hypothetical protein CKAH01_18489 [Colletotrichum kahawae]
MNGDNIDTDDNGQMAGQMPHQRIRARWQVSRVDQNGRNEIGQVVPEHKLTFQFPNLQSLAQALPASNQQPTPNQQPTSTQQPISPQPPFSYYQPQRYRHHRITVPQGYPQPNPNAIPAEVFDTHMMPAIAAFMAGDFRKAAYKTFQAFILAISLYNREVVTEYHREDSGDHEMHDVANAEA